MVTVVTDSTCDLYSQVTEQKGIHVVPLRVQFGAKSFRDGVDLSTAELYEMLKSERDFPTTSQPTVQDFLDVYNSIEGDIVSIHIATCLSGTYNAALRAKELMGDDGERVHVYDSRQLSLGMGLLVLAAKEQADLGMSAPQILEHLDNLRSRLRLWFSLSDLTQLQRGGRIGKATATIGNILKVKPILTLESTGLAAHDKAFGNVQVIDKLVRLVEHDHRLHRIKRIFVGHGGCPEFLAPLEEEVRKKIDGDYELLRGEIGSVVAVHAGAGALGVMYY